MHQQRKSLSWLQVAEEQALEPVRELVQAQQLGPVQELVQAQQLERVQEEEPQWRRHNRQQQ
jgi:hypothetical protein